MCCAECGEGGAARETAKDLAPAVANAEQVCRPYLKQEATCLAGGIQQRKDACGGVAMGQRKHRNAHVVQQGEARARGSEEAVQREGIPRPAVVDGGPAWLLAEVRCTRQTMQAHPSALRPIMSTALLRTPRPE